MTIWEKSDKNEKNSPEEECQQPKKSLSAGHFWYDKEQGHLAETMWSYERS